MKSNIIIAVIALGGLVACDKARQMVDQLRPKPPTATTSTKESLVREITGGDYTAFSMQPGKVVIIDFYADWCGPCRQLAPILDQLATEHEDSVVVGKINVDKFPDLATQQGVSSIPDVRIFRAGKLVDKFIGLPPASDVRQRITNQLKELATPAITPAPVAPPVAPPPVAPAPALAPVAPSPALKLAPAVPDKTKVKEPVIRPMPKDWMPPGMQRR